MIPLSCFIFFWTWLRIEQEECFVYSFYTTMSVPLSLSARPSAQGLRECSFWYPRELFTFTLTTCPRGTGTEPQDTTSSTVTNVSQWCCKREIPQFIGPSCRPVTAGQLCGIVCVAERAEEAKLKTRLIGRCEWQTPSGGVATVAFTWLCTGLSYLLI